MMYSPFVPTLKKVKEALVKHISKQSPFFAPHATDSYPRGSTLYQLNRRWMTTMLTVKKWNF